MRILKTNVNRCSTNKRVLIIPEKVNEKVTANTKSLKNTCEYAHC